MPLYILTYNHLLKSKEIWDSLFLWRMYSRKKDPGFSHFLSAAIYYSGINALSSKAHCYKYIK